MSNDVYGTCRTIKARRPLARNEQTTKGVLGMEIVEIACAVKGCGYSPFPVEKRYNERCRKTGESFYCPAGHSLCYNGGKPKDEKEIERLRNVINRRDETIVYWQDRCAEMAAERWACRWVGCDFRGADLHGIGTHMRAKHGMPTLAEVEAEAS